jgi:hypothetical protein
MGINTHTADTVTSIREVVVNKHAARTTTSNKTRLGIITNSKRELITSEKESATALKKLL